MHPLSWGGGKVCCLGESSNFDRPEAEECPTPQLNATKVAEYHHKGDECLLIGFPFSRSQSKFILESLTFDALWPKTEAPVSNPRVPFCPPPSAGSNLPTPHKTGEKQALQVVLFVIVGRHNIETVQCPSFSANSDFLALTAGGGGGRGGRGGSQWSQPPGNTHASSQKGRIDGTQT